MRLNSMRHKKILSMIALLVLSSLSQAHNYKKNALSIAHPWARPTPIKTVPAAVYLEIKNSGDKADALLGVSVDAELAKNVEIHESAMQDGMMTMRKMALPIKLAPGDSVNFVPGGKHIMLRGLSARLAEGEEFPMILRFEKAGDIEVQIHVENPDKPVKENAKNTAPANDHSQH